MGNRILLVDDNEEFLDSTKDVLEDENYRVVTATDGLQALEFAEENTFDLILMDVKMPRMNGVEAFVKMKAQNPNVKVILFTAYSLVELLKQARKNGVYEIFHKPLEMDKVLETIDDVCCNRSCGCILLADDDQNFSDSLCDALNVEGYNVVVAGSSDEAVKQAHAKSYDILLLDMKLPPQNGLAAYRQIRKLQPELVAIIISGYVEEMSAMISKVLDENAYSCLSKPVDMRHLLRLLIEACPNHQS